MMKLLPLSDTCEAADPKDLRKHTLPPLLPPSDVIPIVWLRTRLLPLLKMFFERIKLHCFCLSKNCVIHQIPATLHRPCLPSCAIFSLQDIRQGESRDATHARRTLLL